MNISAFIFERKFRKDKLHFSQKTHPKSSGSLGLSCVIRQHETRNLKGLYLAVQCTVHATFTVNRENSNVLFGQQCYGLLLRTCSANFSFDQIAQHWNFERRISKTHLRKLYVATGNSSFLMKDFFWQRVMREYCEEEMWVWVFPSHNCQKIL